MLLPGSQLCSRLSSPPAGREQEATGAGASCPSRNGGTKHPGCPPAADPGLRWGREEAGCRTQRRPRSLRERERRCTWPVGLGREESKSLPAGWGLAERGRHKTRLRRGKRGQWQGKDKLSPPGNTLPQRLPELNRRGQEWLPARGALEWESGGGFPARHAGLRHGVCVCVWGVPGSPLPGLRASSAT